MQSTGRDLSGLEHVPETREQVGVIAWLPDLSPVRFAVVTSRRTGRWVFPKGSIDEGMTPVQAAAQEALEEAGVIGKPEDKPFGSYQTVKIRPPHYWSVNVALYAMQIDRILNVWDESAQRLRRFVTLEEARDLLDEDDMVRLAEEFSVCVKDRSALNE